jgi:ABC-type branched-subunit amino acid transport system substrate-binding protein
MIDLSRSHSSHRFILSCIAVAAWGCAPMRTLPEDDTAPVRIGLIAPLAGDLGSNGPGWRDAVRLAVREVNAAGGVLPGRSVELLIENGESSANVGVTAAMRLVEAGVVGIIGDSTSSATKRVYQEVTLPAEVLLASGVSTSIALTAINRDLAGDWYFFRTVPSDARQAPALADAMYEHGCRRIAIFYVDDGDYGGPFRDGTRARLAQYRDVTIPIEQGYRTPGTDYSTEVAAVAAATPDCIAFIAYPQSAGVIIRNWYALPSRPSVQWFGTDGLRDGWVGQVGNANLIDGFLGTAPFTSVPSPSYNRFASNFRSTYGTDPIAFSSSLYDATALMLLAIAKAGTTTDRSAIRDAVLTLNDPGGTIINAGELAEGLRLVRSGRPINYEGASGPVFVDGDGNVDGPYELWRFEATGADTGTVTQVRVLE